MNFLSRMKLLYQISLIGAVALVIFVVVAAVQFVADQQRQSAQMAAQEAFDDRLIADEISRDFLHARRREKDFLLRLDEKYVTQHAEVVERVSSGLATLEADPELAESAAEIAQIKEAFANYAAEFETIVALQREIGLDEEGGLLGRLRGSVHNVEEQGRQSDRHHVDDASP